jgi:hypothetical protein
VPKEGVLLSRPADLPRDRAGVVDVERDAIVGGQ